jgi:hypothetical protein
MKTTSLICLLAFSFSTFAQTIRRVNNSPNITGVNIYATLQAAHDAAVNDDIIYVEPSLASYANLTCVKRLTIIGNGWADSYGNITPNPPTNSLNSSIGSVIVNDGGQGSKFIGLTFLDGSKVNAPNISFDRCRFLYGGPAVEFGSTNAANIIFGNNVLFTKCRMSGSLYVPNNTNPLGPGIGCIIQNCISNTSICSDLRNAVFTSNVCLAVGNVTNSSITNNIFRISSGQAIIDPANSNSISNNLSVSSNGLPVGNGNVNGATLSAIFLVAAPNNITPDNDFQLAASSPAIGIGVGGINVGAFGGASPYIISGLIPYPIITNFTTSGVGNSTTPLQVSVSVRGNN